VVHGWRIWVCALIYPQVGSLSTVALPPASVGVVYSILRAREAHMNLRKGMLGVLAGTALALAAAAPAVAVQEGSFWAGEPDYVYEFILPDFCTKATVKAHVDWPDGFHARVFGVAVTDRANPEEFGCDPVPGGPDDPAEYLVVFIASFQGAVVDERPVRFVRADVAESFDFSLPRGPGGFSEIDALTVQVCGFDLDGTPAGCRADSLRRFEPDPDPKQAPARSA
jgi:hypothetical protein